MPVRMTGMISGMDTESLIKSMVDAQKLKNKKTSDKSTLLEWKQDKLKDLNTKLFKLYQEDLSKLRLQGSFNTKKVTSTHDTLVSVTGTGSAPNGTHAIKIEALASSQYLTSDALDKEIKASSKLVGDLKMADGAIINIETAKGKKTFEINESTTISSFVQELKNAGLNANFDAEQKRFFISAKDSGSDNWFTITTSMDDAFQNKRDINSAINYSGLTAEEKKKVDNAYEVLKKADNTTVDNLLGNGTIEIDENDDDATKELKQAINLLRTHAEKKVEQTAYKDATDAIKAEIVDAIKNNSADYHGVSFEGLIDVYRTKSEEYLNNKYKDVEDFDITQEPYQKELQDLIDKEINKRATGEMNNDNIKALIVPKQAELLAEVTDGKTRMELALGKLNSDIKTYAQTPVQDIASDESDLLKLGLGEMEKTVVDGKVTEIKVLANASTKFEMAQDSKITYNGIDITGSSNTIVVNGLTINLKGKPANGETINITVASDTQANYDMVKKFITNYNAILKEMNDLFYASSARGYDPLSDEEKDAMSEKQIDKWEDKIKSSILRRDDSVGSLLSTLSMAMMSTVEVDGQKYSLSSFGISTSSDYTEKGLLHIAGDEDDALVSTMTNKLMEALEKDPELVGKVISGISKNVYDEMGKKMKAIPNVRSAFTFYNDKTMSKQQEEYQKKIKELDKKLITIENKYYKQFAAMESALSKLQSQTNALAGMLGMNQGQ